MKYLYICFLLLFLSSCYEDKGNYAYKDINEINISLDEVYVATSLKMTYKIEPVISQTLLDNMDNLTFTWEEMGRDENGWDIPVDTLATTLELVLPIDSQDPDFKYTRKLRLVVEDALSGLRHIADTKLQVAKPFYKSWMILHEKNGNAQLAGVEYLGGKIQFRDNVYEELSGKKLEGKPLVLGVSDYFKTEFYKTEYGYVCNGFMIVTDRMKEAGVYCQWNNFKRMASFNEMIYPLDKENFNLTEVTYLGSGKQGILYCLAGGQLYQSIYSGKLYKAHIHPDITGEINIVNVADDGTCGLFYDDKGERFLYHFNGSWDTAPGMSFNPDLENAKEYSLSPIPFREGNTTAVDPNALQKEQKILYMGQGYAETMWDNYVYALGLGKDKCYVYEFDTGSAMLYEECGANFRAYHEVDIPEDLTEQSCITSSCGYNGIFFYSSGNSIYRYDFYTGMRKEIYTHPSATKVSHLDFAKKQGTFLKDDPFMGNNYPMWQQLGIVFEMTDGTNEFVVLHLDTAGKINMGEGIYPSKQVYKGLGKVASIAFV